MSAVGRASMLRRWTRSSSLVRAVAVHAKQPVCSLSDPLLVLCMALAGGAAVYRDALSSNLCEKIEFTAVFSDRKSLSSRTLFEQMPWTLCPCQTRRACQVDTQR